MIKKYTILFLLVLLGTNVYSQNSQSWINLTGTQNASGVLSRAASTGWDGTGARAKNTLMANTDGWFEFTLDANSTTASYMVGFSSINNVYSAAAIEFGVEVNTQNGLKLYAYESSTTGISLGTFTVGQVIRVSRIGALVKYYKNGVEIRSVSADAGKYYATKVIINNGSTAPISSSYAVLAETGEIPDALEQSVLQDMYNSLGGSAWTNSPYWPMTGTMPANITSFGVTIQNGDISVLYLASSNLSGTLPLSIGYLSKMTQLNLSGNIGLGGTMPSTLGNLSSLQYMYLYSCAFNNVIPQSLGNLSKLLSLNISYNQLSGSIPTSIGSLLNLTSLTLTSNAITGSIPTTIGNLQNLTSLKLDVNQLSGNIPDNLGSCTKLQLLLLNQNQLTGPIPSTFGSLIKLTSFEVFSNKLTGSIPSFIGNYRNLVQLYLHTNQFTGSIPSELGSLDKVVNFQIQNNQLTGEIPSSLSGLTSVSYFCLSNNLLSGEIPSSLGGFKNVVNFYLSGNRLTGSIPPSLGDMITVKILTLSSNQLSGNVPETFSKLINVNSITLHYNQLSGTFPDIFAPLNNLSSLNLYNNKFTGAFPSVAGASALTILDGHNNGFTSLPSSLLNLNMTQIIFNDNELNSIPDFSNFSNKANLSLNLQNNRLDYSHFETIVGKGIKTLTYKPWKPINDVDHINLVIDNQLLIPCRNPGLNSTIYWEKLVGNTWTSVNGLNEDTSQKTFKRSIATSNDAGTYRWRMTNTAMTGTLLSVYISVKTAEQFALDTWAFQYKYDARNRMTAKKVPGADWVYMVYDDRDRLVLTQDGNQRSSTLQYWTFTKYDELNRPILSGIKDTVAYLTQKQMQGVVDSYYAAITAVTNGKPWRKYGESFNGTGTKVHGYTNYSYPRVTTGNLLDVNKYLTVTYYDNYTFRDAWLGNYAYSSDGLEATVATGSYTQAVTNNENKNVIGQATGGKVKVLDGGVTGGYTWLKNVNYYDDKYRVIQTQADNLKGGKDQVSNLYDFVGKLLKTKTTHVESDPTWRDVVNINFVGNKLTGGGSSWGSSGAASIQVLGSGQDGWVECTVSETTTNRIFGLSDTNPDANFSSIRYGLQLGTGGALYYIESGIASTAISGVTLVSGDVLRVERLDGNIIYKRNGMALKPAAIAVALPLFVDVAMNSGATLVGIRSSFSTTSHSVTRRFIYDHAARLLEVWHMLEDVLAKEVRLVYNEYNELGQLVDKKLHSTTETASDTKQSIDYRYNIRGWLTSINNSELTSDDQTNDDDGDYFGMNLLYNTEDAGLGSTALYNGNISGAKWKVNNGTDTKEQGYNFSYDAMNRLKDANSRLNNSTGWQTGNFDERGLSYDLNGNIKTLQRRGDGGVIIDDLSYNYGLSGNQLQYVQDLTYSATDKIKGFADGNDGQSTDYTYDVNGNMTRDLNKAIGTSTTDATSLITYNYLNLPEKVASTQQNGSVQYVYDASGRKLSQVVSGANGTYKNTDYNGEFLYEQDELKFINHEEGRVVMQKPEVVITNDGGTLTGTSLNKTSVNLVTMNGQNYINTVYSGTGSDQRPAIGITGTTGLTVVAGERYLIRAKGYRNGNTPVSFIIRINGSIDLGAATSLPLGATSEAWIEKTIIVPSGGTKLTVSVGWNPVAAANESFFLNDFEITRLSNSTAEYQYHLKDHLGNVRATFTTEPVETVTATMENANASTESSKFLYYDEAIKVKGFIFDHTNNSAVPEGEGTTTRLTGGNTNAIYGLARSLSVMPGDVISAEVYAKYVDPTSSNLTTAFNNLITSIANGMAPAGTFVDGGVAGSLGNSTYPVSTLGHSSETGAAPKAYLNYMVFNKDMSVLLNSGYMRITTNSREYGQNCAHDRLYVDNINITQPGYVYIYLSNENPTAVEVYFDDFKVTQTKNAVISSQDYYPFGLTYNSYQRENAISNRWKFQGQERTDDLNLGWDSFKWRNHQPDIGRFFNVDKLAEKYYYNSPYAFSENKVISHVELEGLEAWPIMFFARPTPIVRPAIMPRLIPRAVTPRWGSTGAGELTRQISWQRISPSNVSRWGSRGGNGGGKEFLESTKRNNWDQKFGEGKEGQCNDCGATIRRGLKSEKGKPTPPDQAHGDHMAPKSPKDGTVPGNNSSENLQWLCPGCNGAGGKSNISPEQYYELAPLDATRVDTNRRLTAPEIEQKNLQNKQQEQHYQEYKDRVDFIESGGV